MITAFKRRYLIAGLALLASILLSLFLKLDFSNSSLILKELRIPRLILAIAVGGALALSGVVMQTVLTNPLAEPYTLGIASGAALGAAIGMSLHLNIGFFGLNVGAVLGAGLVLMVLLKLVARGGRENDSMILLGVMLSLTCASLLAIWMAIADPMGVQSINFWLLGDLSRVGLSSALALLALTLVFSAYFWYFSKKLDAFLFGENLVESFGVSLEATQKVSILMVSVLVGFCVSAVGMIGFVGLIVPHLVRRGIRSSRHFHLIPLSVLWGAVILTLSDALARSIGEPHELPVGAVTAVVGAPAFIYLFIQRRKGEIA
ncbi:MAG: iron ABC transporter permease [Bdellovibrionales bacterium]|nr:iron ABC transporter permease [Oligoflexia bacterium]